MKTILLIEDDPALNQAIKIKLEKKGEKVLSVTRAEDGLVILKGGKEKIDFIWLDILLPGMNGLEFLEVIRGIPEYKDLKVAIVTVSGGPEAKKRAEKLGVVEFIIKSEYKLDELAEKIIHYIQ